jgi:hypothetical protein
MFVPSIRVRFVPCAYFNNLTHVHVHVQNPVTQCPAAQTRLKERVKLKVWTSIPSVHDDDLVKLHEEPVGTVSSR